MKDHELSVELDEGLVDPDEIGEESIREPEDEDGPGEDSDGSETVPGKKPGRGGKGSFFKNRKGIVAGVCLILSAIICFALIPLVSRSGSKKVSLVRIRQLVSSGEEIGKEDLESVSIDPSAIPDGAFRRAEDIIGKFALSDLYPGDFVTPAKLSTESYGVLSRSGLFENGRMALSLNLSGYASGVSGKLRPGDVVQVYAYLKDEDLTFIPNELRAVMVLAMTTSQGTDVEDGTTGMPATVTLLVNETQGMRLIELEKAGSLHFALICRGDEASRARDLLLSQDAYFSRGENHE